MKFIEIKLSVFDLPDNAYPAEEDKNFKPQSITLALEDEANSDIYNYAQECMDGISLLLKIAIVKDKSCTR